MGGGGWGVNVLPLPLDVDLTISTLESGFNGPGSRSDQSRYFLGQDFLSLKCLSPPWPYKWVPAN